MQGVHSHHRALVSSRRQDQVDKELLWEVEMLLIWEEDEYDKTLYFVITYFNSQSL